MTQEDINRAVITIERASGSIPDHLEVVTTPEKVLAFIEKLIGEKVELKKCLWECVSRLKLEIHTDKCIDRAEELLGGEVH